MMQNITERRENLIVEYQCTTLNSILFFKHDFRFLSNFYPCKLVYDNLIYDSSEHAYMAQKTLDPILREKIRLTLKPGDAKRLGSKIVLREDWEEVKLQIMYEVVLAKFIQNNSLKELLLSTGDRYLEEGNTWGDTFWGVCNNHGENCLGQILMLIRLQFKGLL
jgi:ribA/ribD-fused uncharacterized protein